MIYIEIFKDMIAYFYKNGHGILCAADPTTLRCIYNKKELRHRNGAGGENLRIGIKLA